MRRCKIFLNYKNCHPTLAYSLTSSTSIWVFIPIQFLHPPIGRMSGSSDELAQLLIRENLYLYKQKRLQHKLWPSFLIRKLKPYLHSMESSYGCLGVILFILWKFTYKKPKNCGGISFYPVILRMLLS